VISSLFKKKKGGPDASSETGPETGPVTGPVTPPPPKIVSSRDSLKDRLTKLSPLAMGIVGISVVGVVFVARTIVSAIQAHRNLVVTQAHLAVPPPPPVYHPQAPLPDVEKSAREFYLGLGRLSELVPMAVHFETKTLTPLSSGGRQGKLAETFYGWAYPLGIAGIYTGKVKIRIKAPISSTLLMLPYIQTLFLNHHGIVQSVVFGHSAGSSGGRNTGAKGVSLLIVGQIYGTAPVSKDPVEQTIEKLHGVENYVKAID